MKYKKSKRDLNLISIIDEELRENLDSSYYTLVSERFKFTPQLVALLYERWAELDEGEFLKEKYAYAIVDCLPISDVLDWLVKMGFHDDYDLNEYGYSYLDSNGKYRAIDIEEYYSWLENQINKL